MFKRLTHKYPEPHVRCQINKHTPLPNSHIPYHNGEMEHWNLSLNIHTLTPKRIYSGKNLPDNLLIRMQTIIIIIEIRDDKSVEEISIRIFDFVWH